MCSLDFFYCIRGTLFDCWDVAVKLIYNDYTAISLVKSLFCVSSFEFFVSSALFFLFHIAASDEHASELGLLKTIKIYFRFAGLICLLALFDGSNNLLFRMFIMYHSHSIYFSIQLFCLSLHSPLSISPY